MKITDLFIKRPVLAIVVNLLILIAGLQSLKTLTVRQYPRSDIAVVTVKTAYVGANADLVRGYITTPLERVIASADGIDYMESSSAQGLSTITVRLRLNYNTNDALTQIQAKVAQVRNDLPPEAEAPIIEVETKDTETAAMYLSFYSDNLDPNQVTDYLMRVVQPKFAAVTGVQRAEILGARTFAMRVWLKPEKLAALNLTPTDVAKALQANNYLAAVGKTKGSMISVNLVANTDLKTVEEFKNLVIRQKDGAIVRLSDVADVVLGAESYDDAVRFSGKMATFMGIWALPSANTLDVVRSIRDLLPEIRKELPAGMNAEIAYDSTVYIENAIHEVAKTLVETLIIVVVVIFLFLGSVRSVVIPIVAIPISLIGAIFLMMLAGFTINLLTLLAIVLAVGLVVDDAIVVVENIERHLHDGKPPIEAALLGARELVGPIIAMTITLAAVYTPFGIQGGLTGTLFREFAFTLAGAVLISGIVALTLSPMMCSLVLRQGDPERGFAGMINGHFDFFRRLYTRLLRGAVENKWAAIVVWAFVSLLIFPFYKLSTNELAPVEDQGFIFGIVKTPPNATIDQIELFTKDLKDVFFSEPETKDTFQIMTPAGMSFAGLGTKSWSERKRNTVQLTHALTPKLNQIAGVKVVPVTPPALPGGSNFPVEFVVSSTEEPQRVVEYANQLLAKGLESGALVYGDIDLKFDQPQTEITFDRDKVAALGVNLQQVGADLGTMLGGNYVNRFSIQGRSYKVIPQIKRGERLNTEQLQNTYVSGPSGQMVQLATFAQLKNTTEPREIKRFQQLNSATIQGVFRPGLSIDEALKTLETEAAKILPAGYKVDYAGESRQLRKEGNALVNTLILSSILIFLVLAAQFESFRDPVIILFGSVPLALSGALLFAFFGFTSINIYSQVGLITLVGLISKNGILIVEFANQLQARGRPKLEAIVEAAGIRLRPILMTTAAMVAGSLPLMLAKGPGAAARNSIGVILVTGMLIGTAFTLFVLPAIYALVASDHGKRRKNEGAEPADLPKDELKHAPA